MNVLILHYHLEPGGVTRIIESQVRAIQKNDENFPVKILCGNTSRLPKLQNTEIIQNHLLNYTAESDRPGKTTDLFNSLIGFLQSYITPSTIIHAHNPNLGKNPALTAAIHVLAGKGIPIINHYHDFADDRPENLKLLERILPDLINEQVDQVLYPRFPNYHYVVLNSCDFNRLVQKGINPDHIRLLPNPVPEINLLSDHKADLKEIICRQLGLRPSVKLCTYPVRPIKRKNIGEFILMAVLFSSKADFAITLEPLNPLEIPAYERWKNFCRGKLENFLFEAGKLVDFEELIKVSDFCITTSVREGFGMVYLEPWLARTAVIGRELPCITDDLRKMGLNFPRLYSEFKVPHSGKVVDFKDLPQESQEEVIIETINNAGFKNKLIELNSFLGSWLDPVNEDIITTNIKIIKQKFSLNEYGKQLLKIYSEVSQ